MLVRLRSLLLAILTLMAAAPTAAADAVVVTGEHYALTSDGPREETEEWTRMLDLAYPQFEAFFGKAPPSSGPLPVSFHETQAGMQAAIRAGGGTPPRDAGGYYCPSARVAYAWRQPSPWYTRTLLLHEVAHQFHRLARCGGNASPPAWYGEGVVEHLSQHTWDGTTLRLAVVPLLSLEDRAGKARAAMAAPGVTLESILACEDALTARPLALHLVRYLLEADGGRRRKAFDTLAGKMDRGTEIPAKQLLRAVGGEKEREFLEGFRRWLDGVQEPWESIFVDWDARGPAALRATAATIATCRRRGETRAIEARFRAMSPAPWRAGLLLSHVGPADYMLAFVADGKTLLVHRRVAGKWEIVREVALPAPLTTPGTGGTWTIAAARDGENVAISVGGTEVTKVPVAQGAMGLAVDHSTVDFEIVRAE